MSICAHCHAGDKNFFAPTCHNCNHETGLLEQCVHSLMWTVIPVVTWLFIFAVIAGVIIS